MDILDTTEAIFVVDEDLLNFTLEEQDALKNVTGGASASSSSLETSNPVATTPFSHDSQSGSLPEIEEELEWLSNKDAFPAVETCFGILNENPDFILHHESPISVLENSTSFNSNGNVNGSSITSCCESLKVPTNYPVRARSKRRRSRRKTGLGDFPIQPYLVPNQVIFKNKQASSSGAGMGRRCLHCQTDKTPQWRAGPNGLKTLCNACGVRYKSGRLLPEYRPANSPTFSSALHSNSHRKVVEMRKKQVPIPTGGGVVANEDCGQSFH